MGKLFGGGGGPGPVLDKSAFDISEQAKKYEALAEANRLANQQGNQQLTGLLQQQATGQGPLANAALKTAQNRNLAQTLAAAQNAQASPLNMRNLLQQRGQSSRDLAELGMQSRLQSQQALGQQLGQQAQIGQQDVQQGFGIAKAPKDLMADFEKTRFKADTERHERIRGQQDNILSNALGAAGRIGMGYLTAGASETVPALVEVAKTGGAQGGARYPSPKFAHGGVVRGPEATDGDSNENDVLQANLSAGEMVVPKSVVEQGPKAVKSFAEKLLALEAQAPHELNGFAALAAMKPVKRKR
jgi:hypothetical protein